MNPTKHAPRTTAALTPHFRSEEFDCHDGTPVPGHALFDLTRLCGRWLEPLRREFGPVTIVSGYRTPAWNAKVGGAPDSYHVYRSQRIGAAADVRCARGRPTQWAAFLNERSARGLGTYSDHVHVDNRARRARW